MVFARATAPSMLSLDCWKLVENFLIKKGCVDAILVDLSKAFDCLTHDRLLANLSGRRQRVKVNGIFSSWCYSKIDVPQGSVLGPLLFNIFINDVFYLLNDTEICNYADDTTLYTGDTKLRTVLSKLEKDTLLVSEWFSDNLMKLNKEKCHLLIFGANNDEVTINIGGSEISESESEKLLEVTIDSKLIISVLKQVRNIMP